jgi:hypothetical protein
MADHTHLEKLNMQNTYLPTVTWKALCAALVEAGEHPADPKAAIGIALAEFGIMPDSCRKIA